MKAVVERIKELLPKLTDDEKRHLIGVMGGQLSKRTISAVEQQKMQAGRVVNWPKAARVALAGAVIKGGK